MEVESQLLAKELSRSTDRQKGMSLNLDLLMFSVVRRLAMVCSAGDGARPFSRGRRWLLEAKEKAEEKGTKDLQRECLSRGFDLCSV
jgi:hypothetical protein